ncbi:MAG: TIGR01210 family radical SAM protein, partial [Candidatus Thermoplasmatota archaeon]
MDSPRMSRKGMDPCTPASIWSSQELLEGTVVPALAAVLRTRGCAWARHRGCTMCGYSAESCE